MPCSGRVSMSENCADLTVSLGNSCGARAAHLDLVRDDGAGAQRRADLVRVYRVKVAEADLADLALRLEGLQVLQRDEVALVRVVLPVELGFVFEHKCGDQPAVA